MGEVGGCASNCVLLPPKGGVQPHGPCEAHVVAGQPPPFSFSPILLRQGNFPPLGAYI